MLLQSHVPASMSVFFNSMTILGWYLPAFKRKANLAVFKTLFKNGSSNIGIDVQEFKNQKAGSNEIINSNITLIFDAGLHVAWGDGPIVVFLMLGKIMSP